MFSLVSLALTAVRSSRSSCVCVCIEREKGRRRTRKGSGSARDRSAMTTSCPSPTRQQRQQQRGPPPPPPFVSPPHRISCTQRPQRCLLLAKKEDGQCIQWGREMRRGGEEESYRGGLAASVVGSSLSLPDGPSQAYCMASRTSTMVSGFSCHVRNAQLKYSSVNGSQNKLRSKL